MKGVHPQSCHLCPYVSEKLKKTTEHKSKSNDGKDEKWKLSNFNGTIVTGSGTPPKLWIKVRPQVMEEEEEEKGNTEDKYRLEK